MLKRKPIKRTPIKRKYKKPDEEKKLGFYEQIAFFTQLWLKRERKCQVCGKSLGKQMKTWMFDHLLEKSKYPQFKFEEDNILLVCFECHECKTNAHPKEAHKEAIQKAKEYFLNEDIPNN